MTAGILRERAVGDAENVNWNVQNRPSLFSVHKRENSSYVDASVVDASREM